MIKEKLEKYVQEKKIDKKKANNYLSLASNDPKLRNKLAYCVDLIVAIKEYGIVYNDITDILQNIGAPSSFSKKEKWSNFQKQHDILYCHRPFGKDGIPVSLYSSIFGKFTDKLKDISIDKEDCRFIENIVSTMPNHFDNEEDRKNKIIDLFKNYLNAHNDIKSFSIFSSNKNSSNYKTDGTYILHNDNQDDIMLMNIEVKNEKGEGFGDSYMQNIAYYCNYIKNTIMKVNRYPVLLIEIIGNLIGVSGIIYLGKHILCDPLTPLFPIFNSNYDRTHMIQLTKLFKTIKITIEELKSYYMNILNNKIIEEQIDYPYPNFYGKKK